MNKSWLDGSKELLNHAAEHMRKPSDFDKRIAFISIDNSVEITIKTFLALPKRILNRDSPTRKQMSDSENSFPAILDLLEKYASDLISDVALEDIEWYHRLRNQLYHNGNGITVGIDKVEAYFQIATSLFCSLFQEKIDFIANESYSTDLGNFLLHWTALENKLREKLPPRGDELVYYWKRDYLSTIDSGLVPLFNEVSSFRNGIVYNYISQPYSTEEFRKMEKIIAYIESKI